MRGCKWKNNIWLKVAGNIYHDQARPGGGGPGGHVPPPSSRVGKNLGPLAISPGCFAFGIFALIPPPDFGHGTPLMMN